MSRIIVAAVRAEWAVSLRPLEPAMVRKSVMVLIAVALSGVLPVMANWGSCAEMPCCHHRVSVDIAKSDCCAPVTCIKDAKPLPPTQLETHRTTVHVALVVTPVEVTSAIQQFAPRDWSPPHSTAERLSVLSILLI